jgi:hypothetical protein
MNDRFDRTKQDAEAAIDRAQARGRVARGRRHELELRIAELDRLDPPHRLSAERDALSQARERLARAKESFELAQQRAAEAALRRELG